MPNRSIEHDIECIKKTFHFDNSKGTVKRVNDHYIIESNDEHEKLQITNISETADFDNGMNFPINFFNDYNLYFRHCSFECELLLAGKTFSKIIYFSSCIFQKSVYLEASTFQKTISFIDTKFKDTAYFTRATFNDEVNFLGSVFKKEVFFSDSIFDVSAFFKDVVLHNNAHFDEATFRDSVNFNRSQFHKIAYFYGTKFKRFPTFLQTIFNKNINFTNTELNFNYKDIEIKMGEIYKEKLKDYRTKKNKDQYPRLYKVANELRDTFRNIKSSLIEHHNMLDTSNYHRIELYCKELELKYKKEKGTRDVIDRIQLMFYRLTSDHHTDLLLILNNVIILIACFGAVSFAFNLPNHNYFKVNSLTIGHAIGALIACSIFAISAICLILGCCKKLFDSFGLVIDNVRLFLSKALSYKEQDATTCPRACIVFFSYITTIIILVVKPALFVPIFGQMIDTKSSIGFAFASLNIIYAIFMFLLIFSLQKTARKNTIVPN